MKRLLSILLAAALLASQLSGCGGKTEPKASEASGKEDAGQGSEYFAYFYDSLARSVADGSGKNAAPARSNTAKLAPGMTSAVTKDGVTVDVGDFVLDGEEMLRVNKQPAEENKEEGYKIESFDFSLGDLHELDDFITIRIPYDTTYCDAGQDPARCVGAKYKNEETGEWEDVLFEVDEAAQELVIYTDHLSVYGAFYVTDEGKRSAYISDVLGSGLYMEKGQAFDFAKKISEDDPSAAETLSRYAEEASGIFFDYADRLDNAINAATLGDVPAWLDTSIPETNLTLFSALGYIATCQNLMKIGYNDIRGRGNDKGEVLNLIRDVSSKVTTYWADAFTKVGSGALSVSMAGVLIIDKMLTAFAEEAKATRMEDIAFVYHHYNESFKGFGHKVMTPKDWRAKVIEVLEKHPDDPEIAVSALEAGFNKYASEFFSLSIEQMYEVASDVPNVTVKRIPNFTESEKEQLISDYVAKLKNDTMPAVLTSVQNYMLKKVELSELEALNKVRDYYNSKITISIKEKLPEGEKSQFADYKLRFAPLSSNAEKSSWTGKWPESGELRTSSTLMGFVLSGYPHTVEFFKPDADLEKDEPEFTVPFVISMPSIEISFGGEEPLDIDAFMGTWVNDEGERTVLMRAGSGVIEKNPDLSWYGGDVSCMDCRAECDGNTLILKGVSSWTCGPEDLYSTDEKRELEIDASSASADYTALNVKDGTFTEMTDGMNHYTRQ